MNRRGLICINTHSEHQRVATEPVYASTAQIPQEFQVQLLLAQVCDLMMSCPLLCLRLQCSRVFITTSSCFIIFTAIFGCSVVLWVKRGK
jgi:hypothetical protein